MNREFLPGEKVIIVRATDIFKGQVGKVTRTWKIDNVWQYKIKFDKWVNGRKTKETFYASYVVEDLIRDNDVSKLLFGD